MYRSIDISNLLISSFGVPDKLYILRVRLDTHKQVLIFYLDHVYAASGLIIRIVVIVEVKRGLGHARGLLNKLLNILVD